MANDYMRPITNREVRLMERFTDQENEIIELVREKQETLEELNVSRVNLNVANTYLKQIRVSCKNYRKLFNEAVEDCNNRRIPELLQDTYHGCKQFFELTDGIIKFYDPKSDPKSGPSSGSSSGSLIEYPDDPYC